jgi:hypothetical protein
MPCERKEQPLSRSALKDTGAPASMEIMMIGSPEDICLLACSPQNPEDTWRPRSCPRPGGGAQTVGTCGIPGAAPSRERESESRGHVAASELPRAGSGSLSHGDTWQPQSYPQSGGGSRCLDLKLVRRGTRSLGYRQWPPGPPRERMRTRGWGQHAFPA